MKIKRTLLLCFFLLGGVVFGALIAAVCADVGALSWLAFSQSIGISPSSPFVVDLSVIQLSFGFAMSLSIAQVITIGLSIVMYNWAVKRFK